MSQVTFTSSVFYFFRTCIVALVIGVVVAVAVMSVAVFVGSLIFAMIYIRGLYNNDVAFSMFAHNVCSYVVKTISHRPQCLCSAGRKKTVPVEKDPVR